MLPLYLLAAHLVGDFVLQTRWQAARKLGDHAFRLRHVFVYSVPFWPIASIYGRHPWWHGGAFSFCLVVLHYLTDSRRFHSTLGDVVAWRFLRGELKIEEHTRAHPSWANALVRPSSADGLRLLPNPWTPIPIVIDQTLHVCQLALLAGLFLT